jgi:hypothetical protein
MSAAEFAQLYKTTYGESPTFRSAYAFAAVELYAHALSTACCAEDFFRTPYAMSNCPVTTFYCTAADCLTEAKSACSAANGCEAFTIFRSHAIGDPYQLYFNRTCVNAHALPDPTHDLYRKVKNVVPAVAEVKSRMTSANLDLIIGQRVKLNLNGQYASGFMAAQYKVQPPTSYDGMASISQSAGSVVYPALLWSQTRCVDSGYLGSSSGWLLNGGVSSCTQCPLGKVARWHSQIYFSTDAQFNVTPGWKCFDIIIAVNSITSSVATLGPGFNLSMSGLVDEV